MSHFSIVHAHQAQLEQLTGCRYAALRHLAAQLAPALRNARGRPYQHGPLAMLVLCLMKFKLSLSGRALEALSGVDAVTLSRYVLKVTAALGALPLSKKPQGFLLVDTTSVRVGSRRRDSYSGHKHQRCAKVQVVCDEAEQIAAVGRAWPGSVHDKTVFERERCKLAQTLQAVMLADKAYAGCPGEGSQLLRPIKKGERAWREPGAAQFNAQLGKKRAKVEHVFARLKTFKVLQGLLPYRWQRLGDIVRALAVVHNLNRQLAVQMN